MAGGRWQVAGGRWQVAGSRWQVPGVLCQVAVGRWQLACDPTVFVTTGLNRYLGWIRLKCDEAGGTWEAGAVLSIFHVLI